MLEVLRICRNIEAAGYSETAKRVKMVISQIFKFAVVSSYVETDPTVSLAGALKPVTIKHFATITDPSEIKILMQAINIIGQAVKLVGSRNNEKLRNFYRNNGFDRISKVPDENQTMIQMIRRI